MPKNQSAWGIEIGAFAIKAIRLERDGDEASVEDFAYIPHAKPLTTPDIDPVEMTRLTLQQFVTAKNIENVRVVVSVPGAVSLARFAKLPPVPPKQVPNIVKFEAVQQIPFPIEEVEWDYQTFTSEDSPEVEVGIFAIHKDKIGERLRLYAEFGIRPELVTLGPLAVFNAISHDMKLGEQHKPIVALDIGTQSSDVVVAENGRCWIRTFPLGGTHFTERLVDAFKVHYSKADRLKGESATSKYARQMMQAMRPVFGDLVTEVQRSLGNYQMTHRENPIEHVFGVGSTFRIPGLRKFLGQQLGVEVERLDEFKRIRVEGREAADFAANSVNLLTAYGLALQGVGLARINVNVSPLANLRDKMWSAKTKWFAAAASVAVVASAGLFLRPFLDAGTIRSAGSGGDAMQAATTAIAQGEALKRDLEAAQGEGDAGATLTNVQLTVKGQEVWPHLVHDAFAAVLSSEPALELAADPRELLTIPNADRRFISLESLSGTYEVAAEGGARSITVQMGVEYVNMDKKAATFLEGTVGKWLRDHADRPTVPYAIDPASIRIVEGDYREIAVPRSDSDAATDAPPGGSLPPAPPPGASDGRGGPGTPPPGAGAPSSGAGAGSRPGRRRGGGGTVRSGGGLGGMSLGGPNPGEDPTPPEMGGEQPSGTGPSGPPNAAEVQKTTGDLEALAPLGSPPPVYGPGARVYSGTVTFKVVLRGGAEASEGGSFEGAPQ
jgi:type IV pilus assembly protein PilM